MSELLVGPDRHPGEHLDDITHEPLRFGGKNWGQRNVDGVMVNRAGSVFRRVPNQYGFSQLHRKVLILTFGHFHAEIIGVTREQGIRLRCIQSQLDKSCLGFLGFGADAVLHADDAVPAILVKVASVSYRRIQPTQLLES